MESYNYTLSRIPTETEPSTEGHTEDRAASRGVAGVTQVAHQGAGLTQALSKSSFPQWTNQLLLLGLDELFRGAP